MQAAKAATTRIPIVMDAGARKSNVIGLSGVAPCCLGWPRLFCEISVGKCAHSLRGAELSRAELVFYRTIYVNGGAVSVVPSFAPKSVR
jgi:hypothetical protein